MSEPVAELKRKCDSCNNEGADLMQCGACKSVRYCNATCQHAGWAGHKVWCKQMQLWKIRQAEIELKGFTVPFGAVDDHTKGESDDDDYEEGEYDFDTVPKWEYNAGKRGKQDWCRYPKRIEKQLERMSSMGCPNFMYTPGNPKTKGMYAMGSPGMPKFTGACPVTCASNYVQFGEETGDQMLEHEPYIGATRKVRRNGVETRHEPDFWL